MPMSSISRAQLTRDYIKQTLSGKNSGEKNSRHPITDRLHVRPAAHGEHGSALCRFSTEPLLNDLLTLLRLRWVNLSIDVANPEIPDMNSIRNTAMRVLVVEDEPRLLAGLARALRETGYAVDTAATGRDGSFKAETYTYDAIVLDVMLPGL